MGVEIATKEDLQALRMQIVGDIKSLLELSARPVREDIRGYKGKEVRYLLGCSTGKLNSLVIGGRIRRKKIGGTNYYNKDDVRRLLTSGY
jgi:hypothetical protein